MRLIDLFAIVFFSLSAAGHSQEPSFPFDFKIFKNAAVTEEKLKNILKNRPHEKTNLPLTIKIYGEVHNTLQALENEKKLLQGAKMDQHVFLTERPLLALGEEFGKKNLVSPEDESVYLFTAVFAILDILNYMDRPRSYRELRDLEDLVGLKSHTVCLLSLTNPIFKEFLFSLKSENYSGVLKTLVELLKEMANSGDPKLGKKIFEASDVKFWKVVVDERHSYIRFLTDLSLFFIEKFQNHSNFLLRLDFEDLKNILLNQSLNELSQDQIRLKYFVSWRNLIFFEI